MITFDRVIGLVGVQASELEHWIAERWVLPEASGEGWHFTELDVARVRLILELRHELRIDEDALPVILSLLDQVYGLRRQLRSLCDALATQPWEVRSAILTELARRRDTGGSPDRD